MPALHIITDDRVLARPDFLPVARELVTAHDERVALHLRGHGTPGAHLFHLTEALLACDTRALLLVNDRVDIAAAAGAGGAQLGARSLSIRHARALLGAAAVIGYSAHATDEAAVAQQEGANLILMGTIYPSASHPERAPAGVGLIRQTAAALRIPVIAIGGVTAERVAELRAAGAAGVALIRAIWDAPDPVHAAGQLVRLLEIEG